MGKKVLRMNIYTNYSVVPSRLLAFVQLLAHLGETHKDELCSLLHPDTARKGKQFNEIVEAAKECGLVSISGPLVSLSDDIGIERGDKPADISKKLPSVMARIVLQPKVNNKDNRFARICAWFLRFPVSKHTHEYSELKKSFSRAGFDRQSYYLNDNAAWDMVFYWMRYIGLVSRFGGSGVEGIIPDPTTLLHRHISEIFTEQSPEGILPIREFVSSVGKVCPVLDGGEVWFKVAHTMKQPTSDEKLSDALSFALMRLKSLKTVDYGAVPDHRAFLLTSAGEQVSFVRKL